MELREYWGILARRWRWVAAVTLLAFVASAAMVMLGPNSYKAELRLTVSVKAEQRQGDYYMYDKYYTWLSAEYLVDDFGEVIKSSSFARDVSARLGEAVPPMAIARDTKTTRTHRILTVDVTTGSRALSEKIGNAMKDAMEAEASKYFAELGNGDAVLRIIDGPNVDLEMSPARQVIEIGLRTLVGAVAAIALAFLLHYLDPTVRSSNEAERVTGLPVLGEIPR
ncbi:MAG TPA: Wzz/FepE/Etk N-terminal domain-containing protein [Chloroflexota bacterium]